MKKSNIIKSQLILFVVLSLISCKESAIQQSTVFEYSWETTKKYNNPFIDVEVKVVFEHEDKKWLVPAFWAGENKWSVRFAPPVEGEFTYYVESSDKSNPDFNGNKQSIKVIPYQGENALLSH